MSYILDALRRADAERRGVPPQAGLTEPAVLVDRDGDGEGDAPAERARPWIWLLAGAGLVLIAALVWNLWRGQAAPSPDAPIAVPAVAPAAPPVAAAVPPPVTAPPPAPEADTLPNFPPALPETKPAAAVPVAPQATAPAALPPAAPPVRGAPPPGITVVPAAPAARAADRVLTVAELPDGVRRDLPKLTVGGAMYSERVADRMVVFNGQVFKEGDAVTREVTLRQIRLKSAVIEFRGHRIEVGY